jgi:hypothetical protein
MYGREVEAWRNRRVWLARQGGVLGSFLRSCLVHELPRKFANELLYKLKNEILRSSNRPVGFISINVPSISVNIPNV